MARGQRSNKGGQGVNTKRPVEAGNRQTEDDMPQQTASTNNKSGTSASRNRNKHKNEEEFRAMDESPTNTPAATSEAVTSKREHHPKATPQPTSEQIMIAQLIGGDTKSDDPNQRQKIQKVMDITGKEEDAVSTALFDAAWDENRAIEILLEDGDQLSAWEESGSKKRKNKLKQAADDASKDDWDDAENFNNQDGREKSRSRGPPRMRRGGSQAPSGGGNHRNNNNAYRDQASHEREELQSGGGPQSRGAGPRRGDPSSRRGAPAGGGVSRGGGRAFQSRQQKPEPQGGSAGVGAFSGSIDTWNNPPSISGSGGGTGTATGERGGSSVGSSSGIVNSGAAPGGPAGPGPQRRTRGSGGKDAFDNAGNWGDDFPPADDWDNEEYTGSLADTKVFTARSSIGGPAKPTGRPQGPSEPQQVQQPPNSTVIGPNRSFSSTVNGPASAAPGVPPTSSVSSYSQSIDLSTLLQKPTTQSSLNASTTQQQQALLQFAQQGTETLRAGLGIGQNNTVGANRAPGNLNSYSPESNAPSAPSMDRSFTNQSSNSYVGQGSAFTSIKPSGQVPSSNGSPNGPAGINLSQQRTSAPPPSKVPVPSSSMQQSAAAAAVSSTQSRSRMPPSSKIPSSAVEMPGDNATQLDVQFGGLDLKFGGSANDGSGMGGFEYTSSGVSSSVDDQTSKYLSDKAGPKPVVSSWGMKSGVGGMPIVSVSSNMPAVSYPSNKMGDGNQSSISASSILPKSTSAGGINSNVFASSQQQQLQQQQQQQQQQRSQSGVMDMKSVQQQQQQQHQNDSLGSYYSNYGQQQSKPYHHQSYGVQNQYSNYNNQNSYQNSSPSGYGSQNNYSSSSTQSSGYKMPSSGGNQYQQQPQQQQHDSLNKFDSMSSSSSMAVQNAAAAVLGLTTTTNALSGKVSATTAGKVPSVPSIPPGVASMLPQHYMASLPPAAFYGLQQPAAAMYSAYGGTGGLEDLAALQRSAGLHTLQPSSGYYDPTSQYAANSLAAGGGGSRNDGSSNLNSIGGNNTSSSATGGSGSSGSNSNSDKTGGFGAASGVVSSTDSNSSPIPSTGLQSNQQSQQQQQAAAQATFNLAAASNAFAAQQHMPPGYAYFYGGVPGLQAYGATAAASAQYPGTVPMTVPTAGGSSTSQFQKTYGYGSAYDTLGQPGNKDFSSSYSTGNGAGKSSGGGSQAPAAGGHQYWGNSPLASGQLW